MNRFELGRAIMDLIAAAQGQPVDVETMARQLGVEAATVQRELRWLEDQGTLRAAPPHPVVNGGASRIRLFICHASADAGLAEALVDLFVAALRPPEGAIRCSDVPGYKLEAGANIDEQLRAEVYGADAFVGLISAAAVGADHRYVHFELGARWGSRRHFAPLLAPGVDAKAIGAPINAFNMLRIDREDELHQLVTEIARTLRIVPQSPNVYLSALRRLGRSAGREAEPEPRLRT